MPQAKALAPSSLKIDIIALGVGLRFLELAEADKV